MGIGNLRLRQDSNDIPALFLIMARKLKIKPHPQQLDLFSAIEGLPTNPVDELPVHPSIADFAVNVRKSASEPADSDPHDLLGDIVPARTMRFMSMGSGSSGNCSYIGDSDGGFLVDAGIDTPKIEAALKANGISMDSIRGICLTHDHSDHVRYVYSLVRRRKNITVYCTPKVFGGIMRRHSISRRLRDYFQPIYKEFPFKIGNFELTAFDVSHDGTDNSGFFVTNGSHKFAIATDLGCITPRVDHYMRKANAIIIEANYDKAMLASGPYPAYLKARIEADNGHMDNDVTAHFLADIYTPQLTHIFLCHLSQDNNTPEKAIDTVRRALLGAGVNGVGDATGSIESRRLPLQLTALPRYSTSLLYAFQI